MSSVGQHGELAYVGGRGDPASIAQMLRARAEMTPDASFVTFEGASRSFGGMLERAEAAAAALASLGVARRDKVLLMLPNCPEFLDFWFGTALLGAVLVPVNTGLVGAGLRYVVSHSEATVAIVDETVLEAFDEAAPSSGPPLQRFVRGDSKSLSENIHALLDAGHPRPRWPEVAPGDIASILYTSGTTGVPKGVLNCHNAYAVAGREFAQSHVRLRSDDVLYTSLPLFHVNAQMLTTMGALVSGRPMVLAPRFSASGFLDDLRRHGVTVFNYIGAMLTMLAKQPERDNDATIPARLAIGGAAPDGLWEAFERRFALTILEMYGLTETATVCLANPPDDIRVGRIGKPVRWADVRVEREPGIEAARGESGEIVVRSREPDVLFAGYFKQEEATAEAMAGGWFRTGDRGVCDEDGYYRFVDRIKDIIRRRGENISSHEIERVANDHPMVAESAAIGVASELGEEEVLLVVVTRNGALVTPAELVAHCADRLAHFMVPRYIRFRSAMPKTATQRTQKYVLRDEGMVDAWDRETPN